VDNRDGTLHAYPTIEPEYIASLYTKRKRADSRFPDDVLHELKEAGWYTGRDLGPSIDDFVAFVAEDEWDEEDEYGRFVVFPAAREALAEFGKLKVATVRGSLLRINGWIVELYPHGPRPNSSLIVPVFDLIDQRIYPVAQYTTDGDYWEVVLTEDGRTIACAENDIYLLGASFIEGLTTLVKGDARAWTDLLPRG
jgi:hypothetical protein